MSWVTVIWSMVASACLTLSVIYFLVWWRHRTAWANLFFAMAAASTAAFTLCELRQMRGGTPEELLAAMRWGHVAPLGVARLDHMVRDASISARDGDGLHGPSRGCARSPCCSVSEWGKILNYREVTGLAAPSRPSGRPVTVSGGVPNPWMLVGHL